METRNRYFFYFIISIFIFILPPNLVFSKQITLDSDDQFGFARYCMEKGEYYRAIGEFERFIYLFPEDKDIPKAQYLIGFCYLMGGKYESAREVLQEIYRTYAPDPLAGKALFLIGESYYKQGLFVEAEPYFRKVIGDFRDAELIDAAIYRLGWSRMKVDRWQDASQFFIKIDNESYLYPSALTLSEESLRGDDLPQKNPTTAGIMAAVIPGMGHVYCGRPKDGLTAFLINGLFIWAAVESFEHDNDVLGGILTFLELGWYSGNIYSAVNSAHKYNRKVRNDFLKGLADRLDLNLFTSKTGHLGLAFRFAF